MLNSRWALILPLMRCRPNHRKAKVRCLSFDARQHLLLGNSVREAAPQGHQRLKPAVSTRSQKPQSLCVNTIRRCIDLTVRDEEL